MHDSQYKTVQSLMAKYFVKDSHKVVYDIGSQDVNGSHKPAVKELGLEYLGVDMVDGKNVDLVLADPYQWNVLGDSTVEYMISGSCLEHVEAPWLWAKQAEQKLSHGGILIVLVPWTLGEHRYPVDCYRYLPDGLKFLFCKWARLRCLECAFNENYADTFFVGQK